MFITGSGRCGECHVKMFDEWEVSSHAHAVSSSFYKAAVASANDTTCQRCHAPLAAEAPGEVVAGEGVTCDVCHTLRDPEPSKDGGRWTLAVHDMVKYGPRCDLADHYFHRMGCSPEHTKAELCGSCHWWEPNGIPVLTEYADWKAGPQAAQGMQCQTCHMPGEKAPLAEGSPKRHGVPHHGLLGLASDLRRRALGLDVTVSRVDDKLAVAVVIKNRSAGHAVPAGLPERRVVVRVTLKDPAGAVVATETRALGRRLVDAQGSESPFWRAARVDSDTRIPVGGRWSDTLHVPGATAGTLDVDVVYRGISDEIARQLGITEIEEHSMAHAKLKLGGPLPWSVSIKPPPAGKRPRAPRTEKKSP